ncbi:MAG: LuxR C-terminal-related transcriptional regulator [[Eubacterium] siraeum]
MLTERELDIVKLIADGCSNAEIARKAVFVKRYSEKLYQRDT